MTAVQELQERLAQLPKEEQEVMATRLLQEWEAQQWDMQIETDAKGGKLVHLIKQAKAHHRAGRTKPL